MSGTRRSPRSRPAWCRPNGSSAAASGPPATTAASPKSDTPTRSRTCAARSPTGCLHHRLGDLDGAELRRRAPRAFTQEISRYVFETAQEHHEEPVCGILYLSRLGDELENWAIFEPSQPDDATSRPLEPADPDLQIALEKFDLMLA
jgi:hypothetical protein